MDWLQFFASIVGSLAWPGAAVASVFMLRTPLGKVVPLIRTLKYKDWQIDVGQELEAAREKVEGNSGDNAIAVPEEPTPAIRQLAQIDPRAAVLSAWAPVELALQELGRETGAYQIGVPLYVLVKRLHGQGVVDDGTYQVLERLRRIRNEAVHLNEISFDEAISMGEMCEWALKKLMVLAASTHAPAPASDPVP
ncbi:DUF4145 domain-containing protein [Pseudomonas putida]|uniref:DUF4145 domain-containing protein n=1 Tax=Pseudomonas putida TaxID=303 RepID=UPI001404F06A|nr:DUF4145 domain-containing protein [Pseudomonas putida]